MARATRRGVGRRRFLKGAAAGAAALVASPALPDAQTASGPQTGPSRQPAPAPSGALAAAETSAPSKPDVYTTDKPGSDFMADVLKSLDFEYVAANPGSSFRGIHESLINYGDNTKPELLTCCHEESSVAMAHGYFKAEGKPMAVLCHGTVGMTTSVRPG